MKPRIAVVIGNLVVASFGALIVGVFGEPIYHWYLTGDLWIMWMGGFGVFTTFGTSPVEFIIQFGIYALSVGLGIFCLAAALILPAYRRRGPERED
jgi:hypothetical protein